MPDVVGIRFKSCGKIYDFEINGVEVRRGDRVIVESEFGLSIGHVVTGPLQRETSDKAFKKILRLANAEDLQRKQDNENFERETKSFCSERIMARGLPMKLVCAEVTLDRKRIIFYFTADGRIDFRELVKDLAAKFKTRIEMRQIGVRDKAKLVGGLGLCGKELCCRLFLTSFEPISIKMAKQQDLTLNTGKLSGICGRLMCCLGYEYSDSAAERISQASAKTAPDEGEKTVPGIPEEEEILMPEPVCCSPEVTPAPQGNEAQSAKPAEQQRPDGFRRHKRRRRHRKRPKKNE